MTTRGRIGRIGILVMAVAVALVWTWGLLLWVSPVSANFFYVAAGNCPTGGASHGDQCYRQSDGAQFIFVGGTTGWAQQHVSDPATGIPGMPPLTFATLGTPANGSLVYCSNCASPSNPCTGSSTGALAFRQAGTWKCF